MFKMLKSVMLEAGRPCSEALIVEAERILGFALPQELRAAYRAVNGFMGASHVRFLYPLVKSEPFSLVTLLELTQILRGLPEASTLWREAVAFGDYGIGSIWGMTSNGRVFEWWPQDGAEAFYLDVSLQELWIERSDLFQSLSSVAPCR